jgi:hypothetical protein
VFRSNQTLLSRNNHGRPPGEAGEHSRRGKAADRADQAAGDEVHGVGQRRTGHAEIEIASDGQVGGQPRILEVGKAGRMHACGSQPVVEERRHAIAQVVADRRLHRGQHLDEHEQHARDRQRHTQRPATLDRGDEHARRDGKQHGHDAVQDDHGPPRERERCVGARQLREEPPLFALTKAE